MSWLLRETHAEELATTPSHALVSEGVAVALPLRRQNSALVGFLVFVFPRRPPASLELALKTRIDQLGIALADRPYMPELDLSPSLSAVR
jgi:hypothetical protein